MSKEEAIEILSDMRCECNLFGDEEEATRYHALSWAINAMNTELKHGRWIEDEYGIPHCSECKAISNSVFRNYCPNCGAEMDLTK